MKLKVFAVIDTNVVISSLLSDSGFPAQVCNLINSGNIIPLFDERILDEYYNVLHYPKFKDKITERDSYDALYKMVSNGLLVNDVEKTKTELSDDDDIPFFEVKEYTEELNSRLVTGNSKHFPDDADIVSPQAMISIMNHLDRALEQMEKIWEFDTNYHESVAKLIEQYLTTSKYTSGKDLINEIFDTRSQKIKSSYFERD